MEFDFEVRHRSGKDHVNADCLSRLPACEQCNLKHSEPKKRRYTKIINIIRNQNTINELSILKRFLEDKTDLNEIDLKSTSYWRNKDDFKLVGKVIVYTKDNCSREVLSKCDGKKKAEKYHSFLAHPGFGKLYNTLQQIYFLSLIHI